MELHKFLNSSNYDTQMKELLKQLIDINKMYIVNVTSGDVLPTDSYIAKDVSGKHYFANKAIVNNFSHHFEALSTGRKSFWILVNDDVWSEKWGGKEVSTIYSIYETKIECQQFKTNKLCNLLLNIKSKEILKLQLDAVRNPLLGDNTENAVLYGNIIKILKQGLIDLKSITPYEI